ncbi:Protein OS-9 homolog [Talaromyces islandicus]|uniref:Endoplasmic reticulum lectin n=1 Tax=Talaromyces islandicus TaxID=28573 RepID=A0A0U1M932_TALIS|nr:Protein OS-9 homolog [Talaromyces islandicus]
MRQLHKTPLLLALIAAPGALATKRPFSIHDDVLAFPQFNVVFPEEYILQSEATAFLKLQAEKWSKSGSVAADRPEQQRDLGQHTAQKPLGGKHGDNADWDSEALLEQFKYEEMTLDGLRYLCNIPRVQDNSSAETSNNNKTSGEDAGGDEEAEKKTDEETEIARATGRGLELLQEMEGTCMYYVSGWWSYSFCYKKQVRQFHALPAGPGVPNYPPMEDPTTHSFVLGKFQREDDDEEEVSETTDQGKKRPKAEVAKLQTKGESRYLVQKLGGGTTCDLTGAERKIEVQFHCHPQSTDRIGWIKELTTCTYLMVIYTPRLCHDVAFQLPQPEDVHAIECREILEPDEVADFEAMKAHHESQRLVNSGSEEFLTVGGIQVGAMKQVGSEGRVIEKGRVASIGEELVEVVAKRENGDLSQLSKEDLKKLELNVEKVESFQKQLDEIAKGKDWKLEMVEANGERMIRAVVDPGGGEESEYGEGPQEPEPPAKDEGKASEKKEQTSGDDKETGSEEWFKEEL